ncbi:MAG: tetratricopeptide repeat protein [Myxococcota bacterium]
MFLKYIYITLLPAFLILSFSQGVSAQSSGATRDAINQLKKGERAIDSGNIEKAKSAFNKAIKIDPNLASAWEKLASIEYAESNFKKAFEISGKGLENNPDSASIKLWYGLSAQILGKIKEGTKKLEEAITSNSDLFLAYYEPANKIGLARYYQKTNDWKKAAKYFRAFLKNRPAEIKKEVDYKVNFRLGETLIHLEKYKEALDYCQESLKLKSRYPSAQWCTAKALRKNGEYSKSLIYYRKIKKYSKKKPKIYLGLAISHFYAGNGLKAIGFVKKYLKVRPKDHYAHILAGDLYFATGRKNQGLKSYQQAIKLNKNAKKAYIKLGVGNINLKRYEKSLETMKKAAVIWPQDLDILLPLAYSYFKTKKLKKAYNILKNYDKETENPGYYTILGMIAYAYGKNEKARQILTKARQLRPEHRQTRLYSVQNLAKISYEKLMKNDFDYSLKLLNSAHEISPENTNIIRNIALLYLIKNNLDKSKTFIDKGLKLLPNDFYFNRLLGRLHLEKKQYEEAVKLLELSRTRAKKRSSEVQARVEMDLSVAYLATGKSFQAVEVLKNAWSNSLNRPKLAKSIANNLVGSLIARASQYLTTGKGAKALEDLEEINKYNVSLSDKEEKQLLFLKAMAYIEQENYKLASTSINKIGKTSTMKSLFKQDYRKFGPDLINAYITYRRRNFDNAKYAFKTIYSKLPKNIKSRIGNFIYSCDAIMGTRLLKRGNNKKALVYFNLIPKSARSSEVKLNRALALYRTGKTGQAVAIWRALGNSRANCNLGAHYHNLGNSKLSFQYLSKCKNAGLGGKKVKRLVRIKKQLFGY